MEPKDKLYTLVDRNRYRFWDSYVWAEDVRYLWLSLLPKEEDEAEDEIERYEVKILTADPYIEKVLAVCEGLRRAEKVLRENSIIVSLARKKIRG
jgi:hypothetical protein